MGNYTTTSQLELDPRDIIDGSLVNRKLVNKSEIRAEQYPTHLFYTSYGKKYFLVFNGKLRQFKVIRTYICPWNWCFKNNGKNVKAIHELEICGMGKVFVAHNSGAGYNFVCKVYKTPEDYKNGEEAYLGYGTYDLEKIQPFGFSLVSEHSYFSDKSHVARIWRWDGTRAVSKNASDAPMFYSFDGKNIEIPNADEYELPIGYYRTKEECEKDNAIEVEYFADEEEPAEPKTTTEVFFGKKYTMTEDEIAKVKELISSFKKG